MINKSINVLNIALILFLIYCLQGIIYPTGSVISQASLFLFLIIGLVCYLTAMLRKRNPEFVKWFMIFFIILLVTFLVSPKIVTGTEYEAIGEVSTFIQFKEMIIFIFSFFIAYVPASKSQLSDSYLTGTSIIFILLAISRFIFSRDLLAEDMESFTNNAAYFTVAVIPYLPFIAKRHKVLCIIGALVLIALIVASAKRGAIVCMIAALVFSICYYVKVSKVKFKHVAFAIAAILIVSVFIYYSIISNEYLMFRLEYTHDEGIGARSIAYKVLFNHWISETNIFYLLFGNGTAQTVSVWGNYAHNDWLELLIDNGLLGVITYFMLFLSGFRYIKRLVLDNIYKVSAYLCLIIWFLETCFSMGFTSFMNSAICILLGMIIGKNEFHKKNAANRIRYEG